MFPTSPKCKYYFDEIFLTGYTRMKKRNQWRTSHIHFRSNKNIGGGGGGGDGGGGGGGVEGEGVSYPKHPDQAFPMQILSYLRLCYLILSQHIVGSLNYPCMLPTASNKEVSCDTDQMWLSCKTFWQHSFRELWKKFRFTFIFRKCATFLSFPKGPQQLLGFVSVYIKSV